MEPLTKQHQPQRNRLLVIPLLILPFITLAFWVLGGGKTPEAEKAPKGNGLNTSLPAAALLEKQPDKMRLYQLKRQDSQRAEVEREAASYHKATDTALGWATAVATGFPSGLQQGPEPVADQGSLQAVEAQLAALEQTLQRPPTIDTPQFSMEPPDREAVSNSLYGTATETLSSTSQALQHHYDTPVTPETPDPELQKLDDMLNKLLQLQQPESIQDPLQAHSAKDKGRVFAVSTDPRDHIATVMHGSEGEEALVHAEEEVVFSSNNTATGFCTLENPQPQEDGLSAGIEAVVHETQTVTPGARLKLRLLQSVYVSGVCIPKGHFVYGSCRLENTRMHIQIQSIRYGNRIFPVHLAVYGMDGQEGLFVPGSSGREVLKNRTAQGLQSLRILQTNPSLEAQAAETGISGLKGWLSNKARKVRVTVQTGFRVLLVDQKTS